MGQSRRRSVHVFALRLHLLKIAWLSKKAKIMSQSHEFCNRFGTYNKVKSDSPSLVGHACRI